jgi:hypothetical protein
MQVNGLCLYPKISGNIKIIQNQTSLLKLYLKPNRILNKALKTEVKTKI